MISITFPQGLKEFKARKAKWGFRSIFGANIMSDCVVIHRVLKDCPTEDYWMEHNTSNGTGTMTLYTNYEPLALHLRRQLTPENRMV